MCNVPQELRVSLHGFAVADMATVVLGLLCAIENEKVNNNKQ